MTFEIVMAVILVISAVVLLLVLFYITRKSRLNIPGPKGLPIIGNIFELDKKRPHVSMSNWAKEYGQVYKIRFFHRDIVIISGYDALYEALVKRGREFAGRPKTYRIQLLNRNAGIPFQTPNDTWRVLRKATQSQIRQYGSGMERLEQILMEIGLEMVDKFMFYKGEAFNPRPDMYDMTLRTIIILMFGEFFAKDDPVAGMFKEKEALIRIAFGQTGQGVILDAFPFLRFFGNKTYKDLIRCRQIDDDVWKVMKPRLIKRMEDEGVVSIAHALMEACDKPTKGNVGLVTEHDVHMTVVTLVIAGIGTTTNSIYALMNILIHRPDVQDKLHAEVDAALEKYNGDLSSKCKEDMPYTRAVIFELLRYTSIAPFAVPHESTCETEVAGYAVPAGTLVLMNTWGSHHDEQFWGDPSVFRPERFLDACGMLVLADHPARKRILAFGAGHRVCLGESLALTRLFMWTGTLMKHFTLEPATPGQQPCHDPKDYTFGAALSPQDYQLRMIPR